MKKLSKVIVVIVIVLLIAIIGVSTWMLTDNERMKELENQISNMNKENSNNESDDNQNSTNTSGKENNITLANNIVNGNITNANSTSSNNEVVKSDSKKAFSEDDLVIESFRLGESAKAVEAVYSDVKSETKFYSEAATGYEVGELNYPSLGLKVTEAYENQDDGDGSMIGIEIYGNSKLETARGIKIGSEKEDILNAYPENAILKSDMIDENKTIIVGYPNSEPVYGSEKGNIYYSLENGKVSNILLSYAIAE